VQQELSDGLLFRSWRLLLYIENPQFIREERVLACSSPLGGFAAKRHHRAHHLGD
jgi:hypothetical protein